MCNGVVQPTALGATRLLDQRAALLARAGAPDDALRDITEALSEVLDSAEPVLRRVALDDPDGLARRLAAEEPVNPVRDEADLRDRFDDDRRVFVLEHPELPGRPLNVVWVALREGLPDTLAEVLDPHDASLDVATADTAVFYSVWNPEAGLAGLGRASHLLTEVLAALAAELPGLGTFATLSPVPRLRRWAQGRGEGPAGDAAAPPGELATLCARHLTSLRGDGRPVDPVARFHLGNGARLLRVLPGADPSALGMQRSWGAMATYRYAPEDRARNRAELEDGHPAVGPEVAALLGPA